MTNNYLFVYGLLRKSAQHEMGRLLNDHAEFIGKASFLGRLYMIDYYPGVIPSEDPRDEVIGEVLKLNDPSILEKIDEFEGVGAQFESPNEYGRELHQVTLSDGETVSAWVYIYNWEVKDEKLILSGDFFQLT